MWFFNVHLILLTFTSNFPEKQIHFTANATDLTEKNFWAHRVVFWPQAHVQGFYNMH